MSVEKALLEEKARLDAQAAEVQSRLNEYLAHKPKDRLASALHDEFCGLSHRDEECSFEYNEVMASPHDADQRWVETAEKMLKVLSYEDAMDMVETLSKLSR